MLEDGLDREIREHGAGELAQDIRQLPLACHDPPGPGRGPQGLGGERRSLPRYGTTRPRGVVNFADAAYWSESGDRRSRADIRSRLAGATPAARAHPLAPPCRSCKTPRNRSMVPSCTDKREAGIWSIRSPQTGSRRRRSRIMSMRVAVNM